MELDFWTAGSLVTKAALYATSFAAAGAALFVVWLRERLTAGERRAIARYALALGVGTLLLSLLRVGLLTVALGSSFASVADPFLLQLILEGGEGRSALLRLSGLAVMPAAWSAVRWRRAAGLVGAAAVGLSFAVTGHTSALAGFLPKALLALHLAAIAFWLGALYPLRLLAGGTDLPRIAAVMKRFGDMAALVVPLLLAGGVALAWILVGSSQALFTTGYGQLLLLKLAAVAVLLALAATNKLVLTPRLLGGDPAAARALRRSIAAEIGFALVILGVTATFTSVLGPPALE